MTNKKGAWRAVMEQVRRTLSVVPLLILLAAPLSFTTVSAGPVTAPSCTGAGEKITTDANGNVNCNCPSGQQQIAALDGSQQCVAGGTTSGDCVTGHEASCGCPTTSASNAYASTCQDPAAANQTCTSSNCDLVAKYVDPTINLLSILVGLVVVVSIIVGGIQYSTSAGDPQKAQKAKSRIANAIIALVAFAFLYGFLQFIIPGGLFR